ncbi:MAG: hypothetical protein ABUL62_22265 [Myxococcales bacterium]|jgi:hypothetical protein
MRTAAYSVALSAALVLVSTSAWAQSDEQRANARALADQGVQAFSEGRWQDTVDLFDRAEALIDAPTHLLYSARAHAKLHHYVKARELYLRISRQQLTADAPRAFRNAQTSASDELKEVEPHIGQLTISVRGVDPKLAKVTMDGAAVQSVLIGVARPIDPGEHQIQAEAPGFSAQGKKVSVDDGGKASVMLELVPGRPTSDAVKLPVASIPAGKPTPPPSASEPRTSDSPRTDSGTAEHQDPKRIAAYVAFGVGVVGLGAGTAFALSSASKRSRADDEFEQCGGAAACTNDNPLSSQVSSLDHSAASAKTLSIVGFATGVVGVGAGVVLFVLSRHREPAANGLTITPQLGLGSVGLEGTF